MSVRDTGYRGSFESSNIEVTQGNLREEQREHVESTLQSLYFLYSSVIAPALPSVCLRSDCLSVMSFWMTCNLPPKILTCAYLAFLRNVLYSDACFHPFTLSKAYSS